MAKAPDQPAVKRGRGRPKIERKPEPPKKRGRPPKAGGAATQLVLQMEKAKVGRPRTEIPTSVTSIRLEEPFAAQIDAAARSRNLSRTSFIRFVVSRALANKDY